MESTIGPIVAGFISNRNKSILEVSSNHNIEYNLKTVDSGSIHHINQELENKRINKDEIDIISNCFKCQYIIRNGLKDSINLIKKKQVFIIKLIEIKRFEDGLHELSNLLQFLNKIINNIPVNWNKNKDSIELMEGLAFKELKVTELFSSLHPSDQSQTVNLIISFHFLTLQCLLQYISSNLNNFKGNKNPFLNQSIFKSVSEYFLSNGNFCRWLTLAPENIINDKYNKNNEKMLNGYIKVINFLYKKINSPDLITYRSCLILKLIHITNDTKLIDHIKFNHKVLPFIEELRSSSNSNFELVSKKSPSFTSDKFLNDLSLFIKSPTDETLNVLKMNLLNTSKNFINDSEFLELVSSYHLSKNPITLSFISLISRYIDSEQNIGSFIEDHFEILESFIVFIKDWGKECKDYATTLDTLMLIFNIYSKSKRIEGMKSVSNVFYVLGDNLLRLEFWLKLLECENKIIEVSFESAYFETFKKKTYKICNSLNQIEKYKESLICLNNIINYFDREVSNASSFHEKLDCVQDSIFIRLLINNLSSSNESLIYIFSGSLISDELKIIILIRFFDCLEKANSFNDRFNFTNNIMKNLTIENNELKCLAYYHYYNLSYLTEFMNFEIYEENTSPLLLCGIYLLKAMYMDWEDDNILNSLKFIEKFLKDNQSDKFENLEIEIIRNMINFLSFNDLNGYIIFIIKSYCSIKGDIIKQQSKFYFHLQIQLCNAISNLGSPKNFSDIVIQLNTDMKELSCNSIRDIANFNLFQLEYCLLIGNLVLAREKFNKVLKLIQSREEFNVYSKVKTSMFERFHNLLVVSKFQILTSNLNLSMGNYEESFLSIRTAIKLLYSVIKTLDNHKLEKVDFNEIKWATIKMMFLSYKRMIHILKHIGVTRDLLFYLTEFSKLNVSVSLPIVNCYNVHELIIYYHLLKRKTECECLMAKYEELKLSKLVIKDLCLNYNHNEISKLQQTDSYDLIPFSFNSLEETPSELLKKISLIKNTFEFDIFYLRTLSFPIMPNYNLQIMNQDTYRKIIKIMIEMKIRLFGKGQLGLFDKCLSISYFNFQGNQRLSNPDLKKINELLGFKDTLVDKILRSYKILSVYELHDLSNLLNYCIMLLSSIAIFKMNQTILKLLYYLHDLPRSLPLKYDKIINHGSINEILPVRISDTEYGENFNILAEKFYYDLKSYLPEKWSIITLDICNYNGDLLISKLSKHKDPFFIRLNLKRYLDISNDQRLTFKEVLSTFKEIIRQSNLSTKSSTTSNVISKDDRKNWWKARFSLDMSLKELLDNISKFWIGGFKGLFNDFDENLFERFKCDFFNVLENVLTFKENRQLSLDIDDNIFLLFYNLEEFLDKDFNDIFYFFLSSLETQGVVKLDEVDTRKAISLFRPIFEKYNILKKNNQEHLILIPSAECTEIPWESLGFLRSKSISRVPSLYTLLELLKNNYKGNSIKKLQIPKTRLYYLINPGGDLLRTEQRFSKIFSEKHQWEGLIRKKPEEQELMNGLVNSNLFVYLGHGGGEHYIRTSTLHKECLPNGPPLPPSLLIGCSSGALQFNGFLPPNGHICNWLICGSPMALVNLWDVTDKDIDNFSSSVFEKWGLTSSPIDSMNLCEAVRSSRDSCTLGYLNGASPIVYGLPMYLRQ